MTTRPDVQQKRELSRRARIAAEAKRRREAADLDDHAAMLIRTMATIHAEAMMLMAKAAVLRQRERDAREDAT